MYAVVPVVQGVREPHKLIDRHVEYCVACEFFGGFGESLFIHVTFHGEGQ